MYTRELEEAPQSFVRKGKPVFGTFLNHPERLDIRGIKNPFYIFPLPTLLSNLRIKSRLSFFFSLGDYIGCIDFYDSKIFGMAEVNFWNMQTKQRYVYRSVMGPRKRFVPHKLIAASTSSYKKSRYIRISWDRKTDKLSVIFNLKGDSVRPNANSALIARFNSDQMTELTCISPSPTRRRCSAHYYATLPLHGAVTLIPKHSDAITMKDCDGISFFEINRTYMKFISHGEFVTGMGCVNGKNISFRIQASSQDAVDQDKYNSNVLFYDGKPTPLPPVVITHSYGIMNKWIIQDTENMIDLTFSPVSDNKNIISAIILHSEYHTIYGTFEGDLLTADGEKISIKSLPGLTKKYSIRL